MINPSGQMPVKFTLLERKETGIEAARDLVANCRFLGRDLGSDHTDSLFANPIMLPSHGSINLETLYFGGQFDMRTYEPFIGAFELKLS